MAIEENQPLDHGLNAKIPGQSLTMAPGSLPMERPPLLTDPKEAAEYFWDKLHSDPKHIIKLVVMLRKGVPVEYITRTILFTAIMHGIIHINTAMLVAKILFKQIVAIGKLKGVKNMKIKNPDMDFANFVAQNKKYMYNDATPPVSTSPISKGLLA
jgi:hypothetical protein